MKSRLFLTFTLLICVIEIWIPANSNAESCKAVTTVYENYVSKGRIDNTFGFKSRLEIDTAIKAYKIRWDNPQCVSDKALSDITSTVVKIQQACASKPPAGITYEDWQWNRKFWKNLYTVNFTYACTQWKKIRIP